MRGRFIGIHGRVGRAARGAGRGAGAGGRGVRGGRRCPGDRRAAVPAPPLCRGGARGGPNPSNCLQIVKKIQKPYGRQRRRALGCGGPRPRPHPEPRGAGSGYCRLSAAARVHSSRPSWSALRITDPSILREGDLCHPGGTGREPGRPGCRLPSSVFSLSLFPFFSPLFRSRLLPISLHSLPPGSVGPRCFPLSLSPRLRGSALPFSLCLEVAGTTRSLPLSLSDSVFSRTPAFIAGSGPGAPSHTRDQMRFSHINFAEKRPSGPEAGPSSGDSGHSPGPRQQKAGEKPAHSGKVKAAFALAPTPAGSVPKAPDTSPRETHVSAPRPVPRPEFVYVY